MSGIRQFFANIGGETCFLFELVGMLFRRPPGWQAVAEQTWKIFALSFPTTIMAGFFTGALLALQFIPLSRDFEAISYLGGLATSSTIREIGPVLIAFMLSGRIGAYFSAYIGNMRITDQIDAIWCLGVNPKREIILPIFVGIVAASFFLLVYGLMFSLLGGILLGKIFAGISIDEYLRHIPMLISWKSVVTGLVKCGLFAVLIAVICTFRGYTATGGSVGVGHAVVQTAVASMLAIVVGDLVSSIVLRGLIMQF